MGFSSQSMVSDLLYRDGLACLGTPRVYDEKTKHKEIGWLLWCAARHLKYFYKHAHNNCDVYGLTGGSSDPPFLFIR